MIMLKSKRDSHETDRNQRIDIKGNYRENR